VTPAARALDASYALVRPILFQLDAERAHDLTLRLMQVASLSWPAAGVVRRLLGVDGQQHAVQALGLRFPNYLGVAAGLDKNGVAIPAWSALGFGHVEVGTVTPLAQQGNPRPRIYRLTRDCALVNRMGFPNQGADRIARRLAGLPLGLPILVGGNVGKGIATPIEEAAQDYGRAARWLAPHVAFLTANVSSPNTPELRTLQGPEQIGAILGTLRPFNRPVLLKLAPDLDDGQLPEIVSAARWAGAAGLVVSNTTVRRDGLRSPATLTGQAGGLSGAPLSHRVLDLTARIADLAAPDLAVVSVGGLFTASDVHERLAAGARLVQVYTGLVFKGPALPARILSTRPDR
jgi:dihydroorotate dehydrogenase